MATAVEQMRMKLSMLAVAMFVLFVVTCWAGQDTVPTQRNCRAVVQANANTMRCRFPFVYNGVTYRACTAEANDGVPWCSTNWQSQNFQSPYYGNCEMDTCSGTAEQFGFTAEEVSSLYQSSGWIAFFLFCWGNQIYKTFQRQEAEGGYHGAAPAASYAQPLLNAEYAPVRVQQSNNNLAPGAAYTRPLAPQLVAPQLQALKPIYPQLTYLPAIPQPSLVIPYPVAQAIPQPAPVIPVAQGRPA